MSYTIDLIDTVDDSHITIVERAAQSSLILNWSGADEKDGLNLVPSSLNFTLVDTTNQDAFFSDLFTTNETRFAVRLYHTATDSTVWQGFILPDQYSEPYTNGNTFVSFTASDGLGRLRGKYLSDSFYTEESSVIEIIAACLMLTGLELPIYFLPAIENNIQKDWSKIYISGDTLWNNEEKIDAHEVLSGLVKDLICCLYQAEGRWYVEALSRRHIRKNEYFQYSETGVLVGKVEVIKNLKSAIPVPRPEITMVPPYSDINVTTTITPVSFDDHIVQEENKGWAVINGLSGEIYASDWLGHGGFNALARTPDYEVVLPVLAQPVFDFEKYVSLRNKVYVRRGDKISFNAEFEVLLLDSFRGVDITSEVVDRTVELGYWKNTLQVEVYIGTTRIARRNLSFGTDKKAVISFDALPGIGGLLDIVIFQPNFNFGDIVTDVKLNKIALEPIDFVGSPTVSNTLSDDFSIVKDVTLKYTDDSSNGSNAFRLQKLGEKSTEYVSVTVPVLYGFVGSGKNYSVVDLKGAHIIDENRGGVFFFGNGINILDVIYNYSTGEEMVVQTPTPISSGNFEVRIYKNIDVIENREYWQQWSDSFYKVERMRYAEAAALVYRRMHSIAHHKVDLSVKQSVKFSDIMAFEYKGGGEYPVLNCRWDIAKNRSSITMVKSFYQSDGAIQETDNIPPVVQAGSDTVYGPLKTDAYISSVSNDPDGFIVSRLWEKESGPSGVSLATPTEPNTVVEGLTQGVYVFRITVTDNDGATASDTIKITVLKQYSTVLWSTAAPAGLKKFRVVVFPILADGETIKYSGYYTFQPFSEKEDRSFRMIKNGVELLSVTANAGEFKKSDWEVTYIAGTEIEFEMREVTLGVVKAEFLSGTGQSSGVPKTEVVYDV